MVDSKDSKDAKKKGDTAKKPPVIEQAIPMVSLRSPKNESKSANAKTAVPIAVRVFSKHESGRGASARVNHAIYTPRFSIFPFADAAGARKECEEQYDILCHKNTNAAALSSARATVIGSNIGFADLSPERWLQELGSSWNSETDIKIALDYIKIASKGAEGFTELLSRNLHQMLQLALRSSGSHSSHERDILVILASKAEHHAQTRKSYPIVSDRNHFITGLAAEFKPPVNLNAAIRLFKDLGIEVDSQAFAVDKITSKVIVNSYYLTKVFEVYAKLWEENLLSGDDLQVRAGKALSLLMLAMPQRKALGADAECMVYQAAGLFLGMLKRMLDAERMLTMNTTYLKKGDAILNLLYAECMFSRGVLGRASACYEIFLKEHSAHPLALKNCAFCYHEMGPEYLSKAVDYLARAIIFYQQQAKELIARGDESKDNAQKNKLVSRAENLMRVATECTKTLATYRKEQQTLSERNEVSRKQ